MKHLKNAKTDLRYKNIMTKLASQGRADELIQVAQEYHRLLTINETTTCSTITQTMSEDDRKRCNKLLQKMCICTDIAEGCLVDLESLMQKYDKYVTLPLLIEMQFMKKVAKNVRKIVDGGTDNESYINAFCNVADYIEAKIDDILNKG